MRILSFGQFHCHTASIIWGLGISRGDSTMARVNQEKHVIVYTRFSTEYQQSCGDQERTAREHLTRIGIAVTDAMMIRDEGISGEREDRPGFKRVKEMLYSDRISILAVVDQSRLSRGVNAKALITDLVFHGGRFISVHEGTDTTRAGWEITVGVSELQHNLANKNIGKRIRDANVGRILDHNGSAGDHCIGYKSVFAEPNWAEILASRRKPKKKIEIDEE